MKFRGRNLNFVVGTRRGANLYPHLCVLIQKGLERIAMKSKSIFNDLRLDREYDELVTRMTTNGTAVINRACPKASDKKSAYRFINNENVTVSRIVSLIPQHYNLTLFISS